MLTETDVANLALSRLSIDPIISITENTDRAKKVRPVWPVVFKTFLTAHEWSFAKKFDRPARLSLPANDPLPYRYAFAIPEDMVKLRSVMAPERRRLFGIVRPERREVMYEVMRYADTRKQAIFTESADIVIEYTSSATILDDFSPDAIDALASKLAAEVSLNMKNATERAQQLIQRYQMSLETAIRNDVKTTETRHMNGLEYSDIRAAAWEMY